MSKEKKHLLPISDPKGGKFPNFDPSLFADIPLPIGKLYYMEYKYKENI